MVHARAAGHKIELYRESVESVRRSQCLFRRFLLRRKLPTNMS